MVSNTVESANGSLRHSQTAAGLEKGHEEGGPLSQQASPRVSTSTMVSTGGMTGVDPNYREKSAILNANITEIGMGRYQWSLFFLCGMGWLADNIWLQGVAIILPQVQTEFLNDATGSHKISIMTISLYCGLIVGALGWGLASDVIGRRLAFNLTLLIAGIFGTASGGAPTFVGLGFLLAFVGAGVGKTIACDQVALLTHS